MTAGGVSEAAAGGVFTVAPAAFTVADGAGGSTPLLGTLEFRLRQPAVPGEGGVEYTGPVRVDLDSEGRIPEGVVLPAWPGATCEVVPRVRRGPRGRDLRVVPFDVPAEPGSLVVLSDFISFRADSSGGTVYVRGPRGEFLVEDRHLFEESRAAAVAAASDAAEAAGDAHVAMQVTVERVEDAAASSVAAAGSADRAEVARTGAEAAAQSAASVVGGADDARVAAEAAAGAASSSATAAGEARDGAAAHESRVGALAEEASGSAADAAAAAEAAANSAVAAGESVSAAEGSAGDASGSATAAHTHAQTAEAAAGRASSSEAAAAAAVTSSEAAAGRAEAAADRAVQESETDVDAPAIGGAVRFVRRGPIVSASLRPNTGLTGAGLTVDPLVAFPAGYGPVAHAAGDVLTDSGARVGSLTADPVSGLRLEGVDEAAAATPLRASVLYLAGDAPAG